MGRTKIMQMPEIKAVLEEAKVEASKIYDKHSKMIKRVFMVRKAQEEMATKHRFIKRNQYVAKYFYVRLQKKRAIEAQQNI